MVADRQGPAARRASTGRATCSSAKRLRPGCSRDSARRVAALASAARVRGPRANAPAWVAADTCARRRVRTSPTALAADPPGRGRPRSAALPRARAGFAAPVLAWAEGAALEDLLDETEMAPGDFVRNCKQLIDLLRQIEEVADSGVAAVIREARAAVVARRRRLHGRVGTMTHPMSLATSPFGPLAVLLDPRAGTTPSRTRSNARLSRAAWTIGSRSRPRPPN